MPTVAETRDCDSLNHTLTEHLISWTDDLPACPFSGVGYATNMVYSTNGVFKESHEFEDRSFHFSIDGDISFYGVFDGHNGCRAVDFASQRIPAEILFGQLKEKTSDKEIKDVLQQAFITVETSFFQSIDDLLAEKEYLKSQIQSLETEEAMNQCSEAVLRLNAVESEIMCSAAAVVALIKQNRLYVANVGNCRAILCKEDVSGIKRACQLTIDHEFTNEDEILRLAQLGISQDTLLLASQDERPENSITRCIGNYYAKGGFKDSKFSEAVDEPIIAEPEVVGGIPLDESCRFLFLMSSGLHKSVMEATGTKDPNLVITDMIAEEFLKCSTLNEIAQAVVDRTVQMHQNASIKDTEGVSKYEMRDDITLVIRNFSMPLTNCQIPKNLLMLEEEGVVHAENVYTLQAKPFTDFDTLSGTSSIENSRNVAERSEIASTANDNNNNNNKDTVSTSSGSIGPQRLFQTTNHVSLDDEGRIKPYVDFSDFYELVEKAYQEKHVPEDWRKLGDQ